MLVNINGQEEAECNNKISGGYGYRATEKYPCA